MSINTYQNTHLEVFIIIEGAARNQYGYNRANQPDVIKQEKTKLGQAIKDYWDKWLTGLTDEEREELAELCKRYANYPEELRSQMQSLLKKFGYKGDIDELIQNMSASNSDTVTVSPETENGAKIKNNTITSGVAFLESGTEIVTESDGTRYLIVTLEGGQQMKLLLGKSNGQGDENNQNFSGTKSQQNENTILNIGLNTHNASIMNQYEQGSVIGQREMVKDYKA